MMAESADKLNRAHTNDMEPVNNASVVPGDKDDIIADDVASSSESVEVIEPSEHAELQSDDEYDSVDRAADFQSQSIDSSLQDTGESETITIKSNSCSSTSPLGHLPVVTLPPVATAAAAAAALLDTSDGLTDSSSVSAQCDDITVSYTRLRDSAPSSLCSASPFDSPTHLISMACRSDIDPDDVSSCRPESLYLSRSAIHRREKQWLSKKGSYSSLSECDSSHSGSMEALIAASTSTPLHAQGTVAIDGDMITFVADGINELIKRSRNDCLSASGATRSTSTGSLSSSTSGWSASAVSPGYSRTTRSPSVHSPEDIPPIDPKAIHDLEVHARHVADSVDYMMQSLTNKLDKMSSYSFSCLDVYKDAVNNTCDAVDSSIKSMYALMAKCEEVNKAVEPIYQLKEQICEIKRLLDLFEAQTALD